MRPFSIVAPTASADGYGCSAEYLVLSAVRDHNADIHFIEHDWRDARFTDPQLFSLMGDELDQRDVLVVYFLPFALTRFRSRITIGMSMWETDMLPNSWAITASLANAFIVPCEHSRQVFSARVSRPIEVVPFGTDTDFYTTRWNVEYRWQETQKCKFLMSGLLHYRKGVEFALRAFREEFPNDKNVSLTLKTRRGFLDPGNEVHMLADPRIQVIDEDYTRGQMRELYHTHDCLLAPSRGEGSGLTPRDAMSTGMPVVLTNWSGLMEIADERYSYPIPVEDMEPAPQDCTSYANGITGGGPIGNFARPSVASLRQTMRAIYENPVEAQTRGLAAADWMRRQWTWEHCAWQWLQAIERLTANLEAGVA